MSSRRLTWERASFLVACFTFGVVVVFGLIGIGSDRDLQREVEDIEDKVAENTRAVEDVRVAVLSSAIPRLEPGSLIELANSSGRVYRVESVDGASVTIRHIANPNLFEASGCEWHEVIQLDAAQVVALTITPGAQLETVFDC